jgi:hypothetical protein
VARVVQQRDPRLPSPPASRIASQPTPRPGGWAEALRAWEPASMSSESTSELTLSRLVARGPTRDVRCPPVWMGDGLQKAGDAGTLPLILTGEPTLDERNVEACRSLI